MAFLIAKETLIFTVNNLRKGTFMNSVYIQGLTIDNYGATESAPFYKVCIERTLKEAQRLFTDSTPEGSSVAKMLPDNKHAICYVKAVGGVVPFIAVKENGKWELRDHIDASELKDDVSAVTNCFKVFSEKISGITKDRVNTEVSPIRGAFERYKSEYQAKLLLLRQPHQYNEKNVLELVSILKNLTEYNSKRCEDIPVTYNHSVRVAAIAVELGKKFGLEDTELKALKEASLLHDIGKTMVPMSILTKPGKLTEAELKIMGEHDKYTEKILNRYFVNTPNLVRRLATNHHNGAQAPEKTGYPMDKKEILMHEIMCCADQMESLMSPERSYKSGLSMKAVEYVLNASVEKRHLFSEKVRDQAKLLMNDLEREFSFDRNGCIDMTKYQPELQSLLGAKESIPEKYGFDKNQYENVRRDMASLVESAKQMNKKYPLDIVEARGFAEDVHDVLGNCEWKYIKDVIDTDFPEIKDYGRVNALNIIKNEALKIRDYNSVNKATLEHGDPEVFKGIEDMAKNREESLDKRIELAIRISAEQKKFSPVTPHGERVDLAI